MSTKSVGFVVGVVVLAGGAWVGASYYAATVFEKQVRTFADEIGKDSGIDISDVKHQRGFLTSDGSFKLNIKDTTGDQSFRPLLETLVTYQASHLIMPSSLSTVKWEIKPAGESGKAITELFGENTKISGEGKVKFSQEYVSSIHIPKLAARQDDSSIDISPTSGNFTWGKTNAAMDLKLDRAVLRSDGEAFELQKLVFDTKLSDRIKGIGSAKITIDKMASKDGVAEGFALSAESSLNKDRIDTRVSKSLRGLKYQDIQARDLAIEIALNKLDASSVETLSKLINDTGMSNLTALEQAQARTAITNIVLKGFDASITKLTGTVGKGTVDGSLRIELAPTPGDGAKQFNPTQSLKSSGQLTLKGNVLEPEYKGMALMFGAAVETPEGLKASYEFADGKLSANGKNIDISKEWKQANEMLREWLLEESSPPASQAKPAAPVTVAPRATSPAPAVPAAPASAPPPPPAPAVAPPAPSVTAATAPAAPAPVQAPIPAPVTAIPAVPVAPAPAPTPAPITTPAPTSAPVPAPAATPPVQAAAPTVAAPQAPAPTPAPKRPTAQDCENVRICASVALRAAAKEDVSEVRAAASKIDTLPKPDLGNRPVSRKLNDEGLAALKKGDTAAAVELFKKGQLENPRDVELAGNLGFALVRANRPKEAVDVLVEALVLDPRRSSTWTPLAEALALSDRGELGLAALWVSYQWSGNREKSEAFYATRAEREDRPQLKAMYQSMLEWLAGNKPTFKVLAQ